MKSLRYILTSLLALGLTGCLKTLETPIDNAEFAKAPLGSTEGLLVGSFAHTGENPAFTGQLANDRYSSYGYYFRSTDSSNDFSGDVAHKGLNSFMGMGYRSDFKVDEGSGKVFLLKVPAGEYEFYNHSFYDNRGMYSVTHGSREDYSIKFTVTPGVALYVGEILANHTWGKNTFGLTIPTGGYHTFSDKKDRDLKLLLKEFPSLRDYDVYTWEYIGGDSFRPMEGASTQQLDVETTKQLQLLKLLYDDGQITEEQYNAKRAQLLLKE